MSSFKDMGRLFNVSIIEMNSYLRQFSFASIRMALSGVRLTRNLLSHLIVLFLPSARPQIVKMRIAVPQYFPLTFALLSFIIILSQIEKK